MKHNWTRTDFGTGPAQTLCNPDWIRKDYQYFKCVSPWGISNNNILKNRMFTDKLLIRQPKFASQTDWLRKAIKSYRDILSPKIIAENQKNSQIRCGKSWPRDRVIWTLLPALMEEQPVCAAHMQQSAYGHTVEQ